MDHPKYKEVRAGVNGHNSDAGCCTEGRLAQSTVNEIFKTATDAKVSEPAIKMATEYLRLFTLEA